MCWKFFLLTRAYSDGNAELETLNNSIFELVHSARIGLSCLLSVGPQMWEEERQHRQRVARRRDDGHAQWRNGQERPDSSETADPAPRTARQAPRGPLALRTCQLWPSYTCLFSSRRIQDDPPIRASRHIFLSPSSRMMQHTLLISDGNC